MSETPTIPLTAATTAAPNAEAAVVAAVAVKLRPRSATFGIALLPDPESAALPPTTAAAAKLAATAGAIATAQRVRVVRRTCVQPHGRVPLSQLCKLVVRSASPLIRGVVTYPSAPSPEVRAQILKAAARADARQEEARPPRDSKAAQERPIPKIRPIMPFGDAALGAAKDGFSGSPGSTASSRMFAVVAVPLRVPRPLNFARHRLPATIAHGVIAAPPPARPG